MGLPDFDKALLPQTTDLSDVAAQYQRIRPVRFRLNNELVTRLSRDMLHNGAKSLGMLRDGILVFDTEDETSVLMDYCIYDVDRKGRNAVDQYLADNPPDPDSDEMACLHAMQHATYTMLVVLQIEPGVGCHVRNLFSDETQLLADIGLSQTAQPGAVFATRLLDFGDFVSTGGAALPAGRLDDDQLDEWQQNLRNGMNVDRFDPAPVIRACLQQGASSSIRYNEEGPQRRIDVGQGASSGRPSPQRKQALVKHHAAKTVPNRRCRCGSGKMFKNCCAKRAGTREK